jgi:hypothetical protein
VEVAGERVLHTCQGRGCAEAGDNARRRLSSNQVEKSCAMKPVCARLAGVMFHGVPFLMIITDVYNALEGYYQKERTRLSVM